MTSQLSTCGLCGATIRWTAAGWMHMRDAPPVGHRAEPDDSAVSGPDADDLAEAGR